MTQLTEDEEWHIWLESMVNPAKKVIRQSSISAPNANAKAIEQFKKAMVAHQQAVSNQLNQPTPFITMPPAVANMIEPFKVHVVERYDTDMEVSLILGAFSNKEQAEAYAKANGGWEYTVHEFTLDSEVPVEEKPLS